MSHWVIALSVGIAFALALSIINIASVTSFRQISGATDAGGLARVYLSRDGGGQFPVPYQVYTICSGAMYCSMPSTAPA